MFLVAASQWRRSASLKKRLFLGGAAIALVLIAGYVSLVFFSFDRPALKLAELRNSWEKEKLCHEDCLSFRRAAAQEVIGNLASNPSYRLKNLLRSYFLDEGLETGFRVELIRILSSAYADNPPPYIREYLSNTSGRAELRAGIISYFSPEALSSDKKAPPGSKQTGNDFYLSLLTSGEDPLVKEAAVQVLSSHGAGSGGDNGRVSALSLKQLGDIAGLALDPSTDNHLRSSLVLLLADHYLSFPEEVGKDLQEIYSDKTGGDDISRAFAADTLNNLAGRKLPLPEISAAQWERYYNN